MTGAFRTCSPYFFPIFSTPFLSLFILILFTALYPFSPITNERTNKGREKGKDPGSPCCSSGTLKRRTRHLRFIVDDWPFGSDSTPWNDHRRIRNRIPPLPLPTLLSLASLFSRTDSEIRRCPYNYYYGRGGNTESLAFVFVTRDSVAKVYKGKNIFDYCYFFFRFFLRSTNFSLSILMLDTNTMKSYTGMWIQ